MARRGGLKIDPLAELDERDQQEVVEAVIASGSQVRELDVNEVAPDPDNPEGRLDPKPNVVAGIKAVGQHTAGMVQPVDRWIAQGGDATKLPPGVKYVIVFGHGRWAACRQLGRPFRAVVNTTIDNLVDHVVNQLQENLNREDLSVFDEAHGYRRLTAHKLSQHEIARRLGIPQPHINKRLKLLTLPPEAQAAITAGTMPIEVGLDLAKLVKSGKDGIARIMRVLDRIAAVAADDDEDQDQDPDENAAERKAADRRAEQQRIAKQVARQEIAAYEAEQATKAKRAELEKDGAQLIDDPVTFFTDYPGSHWNYILRDGDAIAAARKAGTAVAYVLSGERIDWYTTEKPEPADKPAPGDIPTPRASPGQPAATSTRETTAEREARLSAAREAREARERDEHEAAAAADAREAACARIAAKAPSRDALAARLARRILICEDTYNYDAQTLTVQWLQAAGVLPDTATNDEVFGDKLDLDPKTLSRVAYVYDLALDEDRVRDSIGGWDDTDARHIERLKTEAGYQPSEWELGNLPTVPSNT